MSLLFSPKLQLPPPENWSDFELLCWSIWKLVWGDHNTKKHGRRGSSQKGVDIYGRPGRGKEWAALQCKGKEQYTNKQLKTSEVEKEVSNALAFRPKLSEFAVATTAPSSTSLQELARTITEKHLESDLFSVEVFSWDDIVDLIYEHRPPLAKQIYPQLDEGTSLDDLMQEILKLGANNLEYQTTATDSPKIESKNDLSTALNGRLHIELQLDDRIETTEEVENEAKAIHDEQAIDFQAGKVIQSDTSLSTRIGNHISKNVTLELLKNPSFRPSGNLNLSIRDIESLMLQIKKELSLWNVDKALEIADEVKRWLESCDSAMNGIAYIDLLIVLARVSIDAAYRFPMNKDKHIESIRQYLRMIQENAKKDEESKSSVTAINGALLDLTKGSEEALEYLSDRIDKYSLRVRLMILLTNEANDEALKSISGIQINSRWSDLAVVAYVMNNRIEDARTVINWAQENCCEEKRTECIVRFAGTIVSSVFLSHSSERLGQHEITDEDELLLKTALQVLESIIGKNACSGILESRLIVVSVETAWRICVLLGLNDQLESYCRLLHTYRPISLVTAECALQNNSIPPRNLPSILREDYSNEFHPCFLAAVIEIDIFHEPEKALSHIQHLIKLAENMEQKRKVYSLVKGFMQSNVTKANTDISRALENVVANEPELIRYIDLERMLNDGQYNEALSVLSTIEVEEDVILLQLRAYAFMQMGDANSAADDLILASQIIDNPEILKNAADILYKINRISDSVKCLQEAVRLSPKDERAHRNLASLYLKNLQDYKRASIEFEVLHHLLPNDRMILLSLANIYALLFAPEDSLRFYNKLCDCDLSNKVALLGRAQLLTSIDKQEAAYISLTSSVELFSDDSDFLFAIMELAFATGNDNKGFEYLSILEELNESGQLETGIIEKVSGLDKIMELVKNRHQQVEKRDSVISSSVIIGRMPWVWAEHLAGKTIAQGWTLRTQNMKWLPSAIDRLISVTTYSTNAFTIEENADGKGVLTRVLCPPAGVRVVADLSSLLTLFKLGLLEIAAVFFSEIVVPEGYLETVLSDSRKMLIEQRSQKLSAMNVKSFLDRNIIKTCGTTPDDSLVFVGEYDEGANHCYRLIDILEPAYSSGRITEQEYNRLSGIQLKESSVDTEHPKLLTLQKIVIDLSSLKTLAQIGLLEKVSQVFELYVSISDRIELDNALHSFERNEETRKQYFDLWTLVRDDSRFKFLPIQVPAEMKEIGENSVEHLSFFASYLAQKEKLPLLVDDRVIQALVLTSPDKVEFGAFGSDALLSELMTAKAISHDTAANAFLQLMKWRYRFVLPSSEILLTIAQRYKLNPPGFEMHEIASYVHDCMRDPGLFAGIEDTLLNESMASKLYLGWLNVIAEFVADVWDNVEFPTPNAEQLTRWCISELIPSTPKVLNGWMRASLGDSTSKAFLHYVLIRSSSRSNPQKMIQMMKFLKEVLGIGNAEYERIVMRMIHG